MKCLVLSFSEVCSDPRVARQVSLLSRRFEVHAAGFGPAPRDAARWTALERPDSGRSRLFEATRLLLRRHESYYWTLPHVAGALAALQGASADLVVANDTNTLPLALRLAGGKPVLFDAHEFAPREFEDRFLWRLLYAPFVDALSRKYLPRTAAMTTISAGIAGAYARQYGVAPYVVANAPYRAQLQPSATEEGRIRLIHHGAAIPSRRLEAMIDMMSGLDERFTLDFMLVPERSAYVDRLRERASPDPRIRFRPPVPMEAIARETNQYDIGLFLLPPTNFNYANALPNKVFEFVQARLGVAIGPSPAMRDLLQPTGCCIVADDFDPASLAAALRKLDAAAVRSLKQAAHDAADDLCFERYAGVFESAVDHALGAH